MLKKLNDLKVSTKIFVAFALLIACVTSSFYIIKNEARNVEHTTKWSAHTYQVLMQLDGIVGAMVDQETGLRGYLITGNDANLEPYRSGRDDLARHLSEAKRLTSDNSSQQTRLNAIGEFVSKWHSEVAEPAIAFMRVPDTVEKAREFEKSGAGKAMMDGLRKEVAAATAAENALLSTRQSDQAASIATIEFSIFYGGVASVLLGVFALIGLHYAISAPMRSITAAMQTVSSGDLTSEIPGVGRGDEIGTLAGVLAVFKDSLAENTRMRQAQAERERENAEQRKAELLAMASRLERAVGAAVDSVTNTAMQLESAAITMERTAGETHILSSTVASASAQTSTNVQGVAAASEEMASTVSEIGRQVQDSSQIAAQAVTQAKETNRNMQELASAADRIGDVVSLITSVAAQTNLLALNATIEAARAGEAGKGFAVVAQEVKTLAAQTAKATHEIASQIENIQSVSHKAVEDIQSITGTIDRMSEIAGAIASAVEEQDATTKEISRNVFEAAKGTSEVAVNITNVSKGAAETGSASSQVLTSAKELAGQSATLREEVERFLAMLRAA